MAGFKVITEVRERLAKFGLTLHPDKTRLVSRMVSHRRATRYHGRPSGKERLARGTAVRRKGHFVQDDEWEFTVPGILDYEIAAMYSN